jgi:hypothetical protein
MKDEAGSNVVVVVLEVVVDESGGFNGSGTQATANSVPTTANTTRVCLLNPIATLPLAS